MAELAPQVTGIAFFNKQGHIRRFRPQAGHQLGKQVGPDGIDGAHLEGRAELVLAVLREVMDDTGLVQHALGLLDNTLADLGDLDAVLAALEQGDPQLILEFSHGHTECRLADVAALRRVAEVLFARQGDDVAKFGKGHGRSRAGDD